MNNFEWLNSIHPLKSESWHYDRVIKSSDIENFNFYQKSGKEYKSKINTAEIKGIEYAYNYNDTHNITWKDLLNSLKRFRRIKENFFTYESLLEHTMNDYNEPRVVAKFGSTYITLTGQHRMALAKFLGLEIEVNVIEYEFDKEKFITHSHRHIFLDTLYLWNLITEEEHAWALKHDGLNLLVRMGSILLRIENKMLFPFIILYSKLSINKFKMYLDSVSSDEINEQTIYYNISSKEELYNFKPYLRSLKFEKKNKN